ncbi:uncharacterized protein SPAPADRAFT_139500 [Spathaspora passalidarum NRRL Y-27907]|uniref:Uncharacterized protein n=1 Tax=Spathaspora passalidarum (strain NRRL Y-27907 / 11-Y1) TaxID=619300 RepID=G3AQ05_SPAPN|nr:uncharacterized protein SPAPADRAFT_139500 [Spathaspora passalidarum NRRL Y-27907]EGW32327.1 hypothetical protein SPAPADRAFT_139500 [Spathaspora passalidarum NRRL Y-27907]
MSIYSKTFPSVKQLTKTLLEELLIIQNKAHQVQAAREREKQIALLSYQKLTGIKQGKDVRELESKLKKLNETTEAVEHKELHDSHILKDYVQQKEMSVHQRQNLHNMVTFLNSQRVYIELLERYNPGLTMSQEDNVRKTANKVGLSVPQ